MGLWHGWANFNTQSVQTLSFSRVVASRSNAKHDGCHAFIEFDGKIFRFLKIVDRFVEKRASGANKQIRIAAPCVFWSFCVALLVDTHHIAVFMFLFSKFVKMWPKIVSSMPWCFASRRRVWSWMAPRVFFVQAIGARWLEFGTSGNASPRRRVGRRFSFFKIKGWYDDLSYLM